MALLRSLLPSVLALLLAAAALPASGANDNNAGTVKVHGDEAENPGRGTCRTSPAASGCRP